MALRTVGLVSPVRCGGVPNRSSISLPHLSISKPSWVVRTESNVRKTQRRMLDSPCDVCVGSGRVDCHHCQGRDCSGAILVEGSICTVRVKRDHTKFFHQGVFGCTYRWPDSDLNFFCHYYGRTNCVQLVMLPKGEWPKWCRACGGSGLSYCSRCLGTGEYRDIMGFHFRKRGSEFSQDPENSLLCDNPSHHSTADVLINEEQWR